MQNVYTCDTTSKKNDLVNYYSYLLKGKHLYKYRIFRSMSRFFQSLAGSATNYYYYE